MSNEWTDSDAVNPAQKQDEELRELLSHCLASADEPARIRNAATRAVYRWFADRLTEILDGEG